MARAPLLTGLANRPVSPLSWSVRNGKLEYSEGRPSLDRGHSRYAFPVDAVPDPGLPARKLAAARAMGRLAHQERPAHLARRAARGRPGVRRVAADATACPRGPDAARSGPARLLARAVLPPDRPVRHLRPVAVRLRVRLGGAIAVDLAWPCAARCRAAAAGAVLRCPAAVVDLLLRRRARPGGRPPRAARRGPQSNAQVLEPRSLCRLPLPS